MQHLLDRHAVGQLLRTKMVDAWGVAANTPCLPLAPDEPTGISILMRLDPLIVRGLTHGPTPAYEKEYRRINAALDDATETLADLLRTHGHTARRVPATSAQSNGDRPFPHKSAATRAGLGWIGKTALFVSPEFGSAVRLATVFTNLKLPHGTPVTESECGSCRACVDACPAGCGHNTLWRPGVPLEAIVDAQACRHHMEQYTGVETHICGICIAACPYSLRH